LITENNSGDKSKLSTRKNILKDKKGISVSIVIVLSSTYNIKEVIDVIDNTVIKRTVPSYLQQKEEEEEEESIIYVLLTEHTTLNHRISDN
jgi:hypothetical protein